MTRVTGSPGDGMVGDLVARGDYGKAIALLKAQLQGRPHAVNLRLQLAEVLALGDRKPEAVKLLRTLAADLGRRGLAAPAIAILKRAEGLDPQAGHSADGLAAVLAERQQLSGAVGTDEDEVLEIVGDPDHEGSSGLSGSNAVAGNPLFRGFSREELAAVIQGLRLLTFEPGDVVVTAGEPGASLFVVTAGRVKAFVPDASGHSRLARELGEGDFFGEISILRGGPRTATITAASRVEALELDRSTLDAICATHPHVREVLQEFHDRRAARSVDASPRG